jgi:hypothetical protein
MTGIPLRPQFEPDDLGHVRAQPIGVPRWQRAELVEEGVDGAAHGDALGRIGPSQYLLANQPPGGFDVGRRSLGPSA